MEKSFIISMPSSNSRSTFYVSPALATVNLQVKDDPFWCCFVRYRPSTGTANKWRAETMLKGMGTRPFKGEDREIKPALSSPPIRINPR